MELISTKVSVECLLALIISLYRLELLGKGASMDWPMGMSVEDLPLKSVGHHSLIWGHGQCKGGEIEY